MHSVYLTNNKLCKVLETWVILVLKIFIWKDKGKEKKDKISSLII